MMLNNFAGSKTDQNVSLLPLQSFLANLLPIRMHAWMPFHRYGKISIQPSQKGEPSAHKNMVSTCSEAFPVYHLSMPIRFSLSSRKSDLHPLIWTISRHSILSASQRFRRRLSELLLYCGFTPLLGSVQCCWKTGGSENRIFPRIRPPCTLPHRTCLRVLGMGDRNARGIAQAVHEALPQRSQCLVT